MTTNGPIIPTEWHNFSDWLQERCENAIKYENYEAAGCYQFVRNEWISYIVNEYKRRSEILEKEEIKDE